MTWIETGSVKALFTTTYGRLVLVKMAITLGVVLMAAYNRFRLVPGIIAGSEADPDEADEQVITIPARTSVAAAGTGIEDDPGSPGTEPTPSDDQDGGDPRALGSETPDDLDDDDEPTESELQSWRWIELRRMVGYEAVALIAVLGFTAVLVNTTPARTTVLSEAKVVNITNNTATGTVNLVVSPARVGTNTIHVQYADEAGKPVDVANTLTIELSLPSKDLGPITRQVVKVSTGHYVLDGDELSLAGDWNITLAVRTSDFTEERTTFQVPISE
jgi:copper transport protein